MTPLLEVRDLVKEFPPRRHVFGDDGRRRAVDGVSFSVQAGETFALVGESGSGKTTTGRCVLRLIEPTSGDVRFQGVDLLGLRPREMRAQRRQMQIVFQDPFASLNPRMRVGAIVGEPLEIHREGTRDARVARVRELFELVGLDPDMTSRYPQEFSGGQRQRLGIARAIALHPSFIVADEPVSALDAPIQGQIIGLLTDLQQRLGLTYLFISHDLHLVQRIAGRIAVMYRGRIVELAPAERLFAAAVHPYTQALLSARRGPGAPRARQRLDPAGFTPLPLRDLGSGHLAAI